ncbi:glycosyltransferase [Pseudomonas putida]|uniref:Glycosyltransferase n=2 Tax=Pseudomonas TaxID=286 RepID=A0A0P7CH37_PSEPU|nr:MULTISPECIES: glycosyltransferase family 4 protein [Pseudomonas]KPM60265.1 glycosyltransferase [Pseudomonas putida]MCO7524354.1 glycosyltransferase family 4 protein [Pseudomonas asiatica]MDH4430455.1 glycosyltransferase family 4 protein [Pseudomonas shirazica]MDM9601713.1 glycosyltransferase family 4 protein [Pseudomonas shirazica]MDO2415100.1 glycosyltransferase family 4 protein [Pseudomonas shirazica]
MATRILLLTQWFDPEPTFKGLVFARELVAQGFDVEVVTGFPNYPGGKLYSGYRVKLIQREMIDGVKVTRVPLYPSHGQSGIGRVLNYASFAATSLFYGLFGARKPHVIYAYHPPLTVGMSAALIRMFRRVPVVYDIQDMWPDTLKATGMFSSEKALRLVGRVCDWVYRRVDQIVVLSPGFRRLLIERGVPAAKIDVIYNWCAEDMVCSADADKPRNFPDNATFRVLFAGNIGKAQSLDAVIEAAAILKQRGANVSLVFLGGGVEVSRLQAVVQERLLDNVSFLPGVPMAEVGAYLASADALLVHLKKDPLFTITIPSKTQAYMAAGKPLIMAVEGDAAQLVQDADCGVIAEPQNPQALADACIELSLLTEQQRAQMGQRGAEFYRQKLSLKVGVQRFGEHFRRLCK